MELVLKKVKKLKPGEIRFTPMDNRLMEMPPVVNTVVNLPSWFKRIQKNQGSLRACAGTIDLLSAGVTIPLWTNYYFRLDPTGKDWEMAADEMSPEAGISRVSAFSHGSTGTCPMTSVREIETGSYPKIINPWRIETAPGWSSLILPIYWEPNLNYDVVPAIVHTDFYHTANIVLNIKTDQEFMVKFGTPMVQIIPFKRSGDLEKIYFRDESDFKYVATKGFGMGHISPRAHTAAPYRRQRILIDHKIEEEENKSIFKKIFNK
jgi:hypothetical protein